MSSVVLQAYAGLVGSVCVNTYAYVLMKRYHLNGEKEGTSSSGLGWYVGVVLVVASGLFAFALFPYVS